MRYRLIASDMDETLLDCDHQLGQRNIDAILAAKERYGIKFVPATGRGYLSVQGNLHALQLYDVPDEYVISYNGGAITENHGNRLIQFRGLDFEKIRELFVYGLSQPVCMHVYTVDRLYVYRINTGEAAHIRHLNYTVLEQPDIEFLRHEPIAKIIFQNTDMNYLMALEEQMRPLTASHCAVSFSSNRYIEFNAIGVDKGRGVQELAKLLGIDIQETIAVGDNFNDLSMLRVAGLSVAAGNAVPAVKAICDYTTRADNNDGVIAEVIERFIFQK